MGLRLSASQLSRALKCGYPYNPNIEFKLEVESPGQAAHTGVGFALLREYQIEPGRFEVPPTLSKIAERHILYQGAEPRARKLLARWLQWWHEYSSSHREFRWESEIPFAFDPMTGTARRLPVSEHRAYVDAKPHEIVGTADMIGIASHRIIVLDEKTGRRENVSPAAENAQLRFLSLCLSLTTGITSGKVGLVFPHLDPVLDEVLINAASIEAARQEFTALSERIAMAQPVAGEWCKFCPLREDVCPAWRSTDDLFRGAVSSAQMARIRIKAGTQTQVESVPTVKDEPASTAGRPAVEGTMRRRKLREVENRLRDSFEPVVADEDPELLHHPLHPDAEERPQTPTDNEFAPKFGLRPRGSPNLTPDFERIVERIYQVDVLKEYERLEAALRIGEKRTDRGALNLALDEAEDNARLAHALYLAAVLERARWKAESSSILAHAYSLATAELEKEKRQGLRTKQITDGDVRAKMAALYPDEVKDHDTRSARVKGMEEQLKRIADLWQSRCASVRVMLDKVR